MTTHSPINPGPINAGLSLTLPAHPALVLLERARALVAEAEHADSPEDRFRLAHLAALRTGAAVLARPPLGSESPVGGRSPDSRRRRHSHCRYYPGRINTRATALVVRFP